MPLSPENNINLHNPLVRRGLVVAAIAAIAIAASPKNTSNAEESVLEPTVVYAEPGFGPQLESKSVIKGIAEQARELRRAREARQERRERRQEQQLPAILQEIGGCESGGGVPGVIDYQAENSTSTASGGFQFLDSTWANYKGYARAMDAPPRVQDEKAIQTLASSGTTPWDASKACWG